MSSVISVQNLVKTYKGAKESAVKGISFDVDEGEFFTFLGPNGAGKTTTISILTTTLSKTSGTVTIAGYDLDKQPDAIRQNIGVIFQLPSLDMNLSAEENIRFHTILYGLYPFRPSFKTMPKEYQDKVHNLGEVLGINEEMFNPVKTFSGGMKRKLEIIRSLMHDPKILFLDEPTTGLDPQSRRNLWEYLIQVRKESNTTIFLTTHYLEESEGADRVCIIDNGQIEMLGTPRQIKDKLVSNYILAEVTQKEKLEKELQALGLKYEIGDTVKIHLNDHNEHDILKSIETPLSNLEIHRPSLEDAYLEIIEKAEHNYEEEPHA